MALLKNDNIFLRALEIEDLSILYKWENNTDIWHYGCVQTPFSRFALRKYLSNTTSQDIYQSRQLRLMIVECVSDKTIGIVDLYDFDPMNLRAGVGIFLDTKYRRRGFGYESLQLIQEYSFHLLLLKQLYAYIPQSNIPSYELFRKSGYQEVGLLKSWIKKTEGFANVYFMQLIDLYN